MPYQRSKRGLHRSRLMRVISAGAPMLSVILAAGCEEEADDQQPEAMVFSNPKGSIYEMGVPPEELGVPPVADVMPPIESNPKGSLYDEGFPPPPIDEGIISSNPKGSLYDIGVLDMLPPSVDRSALDGGPLADAGGVVEADAGVVVEADAAAPKSTQGTGEGGGAE